MPKNKPHLNVQLIHDQLRSLAKKLDSPGVMLLIFHPDGQAESIASIKDEFPQELVADALRHLADRIELNLIQITHYDDDKPSLN